jgi:hypothetical protein
MLKTCSRCHDKKDYSDFNNNHCSPDGKHGWCRKCQKDHYQENKGLTRRLKGGPGLTRELAEPTILAKIAELELIEAAGLDIDDERHTGLIDILLGA